LVAGDVDLLGVDHDDVVAGVDVRGVDGLVLAAEATRDLGAQAAEGLAGGVDHEPVALDGLVLGGKGLHQETLRGDWSGWLRGPSPAELRLAFSRSGNARGGIVLGAGPSRKLRPHLPFGPLPPQAGEEGGQPAAAPPARGNPFPRLRGKSPRSGGSPRAAGDGGNP